MPQKPIRKREKQRQEQPSLQRQREQQETQGQEKISSSATNDQHNNNNETGSVDFTMAPSAETWVPHVATGGQWRARARVILRQRLKEGTDRLFLIHNIRKTLGRG